MASENENDADHADQREVARGLRQGLVDVV